MINRLSAVIITQRKGTVPAETAEFGYELRIDDQLIGYYKTKLDAEEAAQRAIYKT